MPSRRTAAESQRVSLGDGRSLGFAEYGDRQGFPILFFHGTPGSRLDAAPLDVDASATGIRLLAVDRPGMGLSDLAPNRTVASWAGDVADLAHRLGLQRFSVLGFSSGGPYALAVACRLGSSGLLYACGIAGGNSPLDDPEVARTLPIDSKVFNFVARRRPRLAAASTDVMMRIARRPARWWPRTAGKIFERQYSGSDREVLARIARRLPDGAGMDGFLEAVRNGGAGVAQDMLLEIGDWGFDLAEITTPVHLWYGSADHMVPLVQGDLLAKRLPAADLHTVIGAGHLVVYDRAGEILTTLSPR